MATTVKNAGLVDADGLCVNSILVNVDEAGAVVGYVPPAGLTLVVSDDAGVGKIWNGETFEAGEGA